MSSVRHNGGILFTSNIGKLPDPNYVVWSFSINGATVLSDSEKSYSNHFTLKVAKLLGLGDVIIISEQRCKHRFQTI
jgi:hypothetical protein